MKVWIDHDDGHAGGYPHECDRCICGHTQESHWDSGGPCMTCPFAGGRQCDEFNLT